jgi:hypothetical protein
MNVLNKITFQEEMKFSFCTSDQKIAASNNNPVVELLKRKRTDAALVFQGSLQDHG